MKENEQTIEVTEEKIYTQADVDREISLAHEKFNQKHIKKLQDIEAIAEAEAKRKFKAEYEEINRQHQELNQQITESNLRLMEQLSTKTRGIK